ncbi:hypothetical protein [Blautia marasmi]|jgi:hypothetical protein|uniref:Uncharacterized protein n=1 Tax=Blautia parvula TaxID=2877527 RepID=A0ABQ0BY53_9FIRM|nr:hypothetical protein [Blautia marasmi]
MKKRQNGGKDNLVKQREGIYNGTIEAETGNGRYREVQNGIKYTYSDE